MRQNHRLAAALAWQYDPLRPPLSYADRARLRRLYGIDQAEFYRMLAAQGGVCAICSGTNKDRKRKLLCVDHCHTTGKVRGLLCSFCNGALGMFKDNPDLARKAADYIDKHRT
jgi:Autographiviridae endonuclease VII